MIPRSLFSSSVDPGAERFGVFSPVRDAQGNVSDFRIDFLSVAADEAQVGKVSGKRLLEIAPSLAGSGLIKGLTHLTSTGEPLHDEYLVEGIGQEPPRRLIMHGIRLHHNVIVAHWRDATEQERSKNAVERRIAERTAQAEARSDQLRYLALALADAEARERKRLAGILHDHFQQLLSAAKLKAGLVRRMAQQGDVQSGIQHVEKMLEEAIAESRSLTIELCPPLLYDAGLHPALDALARNFQARKGLRVTIQAQPSAEPDSEQIRVLLYEAIRELLQNVVQHAGVTEAVVATAVLRDGQIQVTVSDQGKGFDVRQLLNHGDQSKPRPLGMLELRERLKFLGGGLFVESAVGAGTTVRAVVPAEIRKTNGEIRQQVLPKAVTTPTVQALQGPARVLVADDHAIFREGLLSLLSQEPRLTVIAEAADGQEAIDMARKHHPDIILLDINMPKLSGVEVARLLSKEQPQARIVGLSMHQHEDMAAALRNAGAVAYVTKAEAYDSLLGVLRTFL